MDKNPLSKGMIMENATGIGEISTAMIAARAAELALIAGRPVTGGDREQALRELTGGPAMEPRQARLESITEEARWNPVPGSSGHQAKESASEDEDEDGRSESAQLVEEGLSEAGHDLRLQAARAASKREETER